MTRSFALLAVALVTACGDDTMNRPDAAQGDVDAAEVMPGSLAVAVSGDFDMTGIMTKLELKQLAVTMNVPPAAGVSGDPVVRQIDDKLFVINRFGFNNITQYNAKTLRFEYQFSTGANSNPQDVAVVGDMLYVAVLGGQGVVKVQRPAGIATPLNLATALGDADGNPDCVSAYAIGTKVYVACGLLTNFFPSGPGKVAVIDTANNDAITVVTLPYSNPQNFFVRSPQNSVFGGDLLIPLTPSYTTYATGCIARVSTGATPTAACASGLANSDVAGFETHIDIAPGGELLWLAVGTLDANFSNPTGKLMGYDLETGTLWSAPVSPASQLITDVAACPDGNVVAVDRTMNSAGMRVYKDNAERTTSALSIGLPPAFGNNVVCFDP